MLHQRLYGKLALHVHNQHQLLDVYSSCVYIDVSFLPCLAKLKYCVKTD